MYLCSRGEFVKWRNESTRAKAADVPARFFYSAMAASDRVHRVGVVQPRYRSDAERIFKVDIATILHWMIYAITNSMKDTIYCFSAGAAPE